MKIRYIEPVFLEELPDSMDEGFLYICESFSLTAHKCFCGCGEDVFNKLGAAKWRLIKETDGSVSLDPSVGNWKYACRSHYWVSKNRIIDAGPMSARSIALVQERDKRDRDQYFAKFNAEAEMNVWARIGLMAKAAVKRIKDFWS